MLKITPQADIQKTTHALSLPDNIRRADTLTPFVPKQGQQVVVELIKVLSDHRVLVQTLPETTSKIAPQKIDIDVSTLAKQFIPGQKWVMDVVSVKPLQIQLSSHVPATREQLILERIRQLLPSQSAPIDLNKLVDSFKNKTLPESIHKEVHKLIQSSLSKTDITQPQAFKQALASSGSLMESQLLKQPSQSEGDFKVNVLKLLKAVETVISDTKAQGTDKVVNKLPAQVQSALLALGKTPAQLLNVLNYGASLKSPEAQAALLTMTQGQSADKPSAQLLSSATTLKLPDALAQGQSGDKLSTQVQSALLALGKTPTQLLNALHSGTTLSSSGITTPLSTMTPQQASSLIQLLQQSFTSIPNQKTVNGQAPMEIRELMQLLKGLEGVHNKLQLNQLTMLKEPESSSTVASWLFDVPIKDKQALDLLQIQIDQNKPQEEKSESDTWDVKLRLDTQNLGPVQANVIFQDNEVKVIMTAERDESAQLLEDNIELLVDAITKLGVTVSLTRCSQGNVDAAISQVMAKSSTSLLDVSV